MAERMITGSEIEPGMTIMGHCVLGTVTVKEILNPSTGFYRLARADGSEFTSTIPGNSPVLIWRNLRVSEVA